MAFVKTNFAFPFCQVSSRASLPVAEVGGATDNGWPVEVSYSKMFEWYWRAKEIGIIYSVAFVEEIGTWTGTCSFSGTWTSSGTEPDERELVCGLTKSWSSGGYISHPNAMHWVDSGGIPSYHEDGLIAFDFSLLDTSAFPANSPRWKRDGGLWLPAMTLSTFIKADTANGFDVNLLYSDGTSVETTGSVSFDGTTPRSWSTPASVLLTSSSATLTITIAEYYEYDPGDGGGPVWNSANGAERRDPFSI